MKQKDSIDQLFERLEGTFDLNESPAEHQKRFLAKLEANKAESKQKSRPIVATWWKPLSIAASVLLLITAGLFIQNYEVEVDGLAGVSPKMEETQSFFTTVINKELETLKSFENEDTELLIHNTLGRLADLESKYDRLKIDLANSGNDKRVVSAMITNFQNRIELLQQVIKTIDDIKTLKANKNETTI
jgi:arginine decarboxylase-like protein